MRIMVGMHRLLVYWDQSMQRWVCIGPDVTGGYAGRSVWEAVGCYMACTSTVFRGCVTTLEVKGGPEKDSPFKAHVNGSEVPGWARDALDGIV